MWMFRKQSGDGVVPPGAAADIHGGYLALIRTLGKRTAELHAALSERTGNPDFDPEPVEPRDLSAWIQHAHDVAATTLDRLERQRAALDPATQPLASQLLAARIELLKR